MCATGLSRDPWQPPGSSFRQLGAFRGKRDQAFSAEPTPAWFPLPGPCGDQRGVTPGATGFLCGRGCGEEGATPVLVVELKALGKGTGNFSFGFWEPKDDLRPSPAVLVLTSPYLRQ